jgi:hypothetical protein
MSQRGVAPAQSVWSWQATHWKVTASQCGVAPPQFASVMHAAQACLTQNGAADPAAHPTPSSHSTHAPSSHLGAAAGHVMLDEQGVAQCPVRHTFPPAQSPLTPHSTQRCRARSQRAVGAAQWASVTQARHRPESQ